MDVPPITLFAKTADPDGVRRLVVATHPEAEVEESPDGGWSSILITRKRGMLKKAQTLRINHDPEYYNGASWNKQRDGMIGYFERFSVEDGRRGTLKAVIQQFAFSLAFVSDPPVSPGDDDFRYELIRALAGQLEACFFVPGYLLDSEARVLVCADGEFDPDAVFPPLDAASEPAPPAHGQRVGMEGAEKSEDEDERDPPSPDRVATRAMALAAVSARGLLELNASEDGADVVELESARERTRTWCSELGIMGELEPREREVLDTPLGQLDEQQHLDSIWRFEGLAVLGWALGVIDLPPYDKVAHADELLAAFGFLNSDEARAILDSPELRPAEDLKGINDQIFAYHWRLRDFGLRPQEMDFREFGKTCWFGPLDMSWAEFDGDELALGGDAIHRAGSDIVSTCSSIAAERHLASNWLLGWSEVYSETDTST